MTTEIVDKSTDVVIHLSSTKLLLFFQAVTTLVLCGLVLFIVSGRNKSINAIKASENAVAYVCNTTSVLDNLVTTAIQQTNINFRNGDYLRLVKQGVLTASDVAQVRKNLQLYESEHRLLQNNTACARVTGKT